MSKKELKTRLLNQTGLKLNFTEIKKKVNFTQYVSKEKKTNHNFWFYFRIIMPVVAVVLLFCGIGMHYVLKEFETNTPIKRKEVHNVYETYEAMITAEKKLQQEGFKEPEIFTFDISILGVKKYSYAIHGIDYCDEQHTYYEYCPNMRYRSLEIAGTFDDIVNENSSVFGIYFTYKTESSLSELEWLTKGLHYNTQEINGYKYFQEINGYRFGDMEEYALRDPFDPVNNYIIIVGFANATEEQKNLVLNYIKEKIEQER
ncbi:MAG: hypothetical protein K2I42_02165 [Anaeroplasmataceae bacterium]|nr:hypothetical protein [Anaeroplasmataceae bacterium]